MNMNYCDTNTYIICKDTNTKNMDFLQTTIEDKQLLKIHIIGVHGSCSCKSERDVFQEVVEIKKSVISEINIERIEEFKLKSFLSTYYGVPTTYWQTTESEKKKIMMCFVLSGIKFIRI